MTAVFLSTKAKTIQTIDNAGSFNTSKHKHAIDYLYENLIKRQQRLSSCPYLNKSTGYNTQLAQYSDPLVRIINRDQVGAFPVAAVVIVVVAVIAVSLSTYALIKYYTLPDSAEAIEDYKLSDELLKELEQYVPKSKLPGVINTIQADASQYGKDAYNKGYKSALFNSFGGVLKYGTFIVLGGLAVKWFFDNYDRRR